MKYKFEIDPGYQSHQQEFFKIIDDFDQLGQQIGPCERNTVKSIQFKDLLLNVKSFKVPHLINRFAYRFIRKSKARRSYENAKLLHSKNIGTPNPIAYFEHRDYFSIQESYYFSEQLSYDLTYRTLIEEPEYPEYDKILRQFTRFTFDMHENGILFKDHSPGNTLIQKGKDQYHFFLVDLNRMDFRPLTFKDRMKNFSRLTPKKEMVELMSEEYAKLSGIPFKKVFKNMWKYTVEFRTQYDRKKVLKQKYLK